MSTCSAFPTQLLQKLSLISCVRADPPPSTVFIWRLLTALHSGGVRFVSTFAPALAHLVLTLTVRQSTNFFYVVIVPRSTPGHDKYPSSSTLTSPVTPHLGPYTPCPQDSRREVHQRRNPFDASTPGRSRISRRIRWCFRWCFLYHTWSPAPSWSSEKIQFGVRGFLTTNDVPSGPVSVATKSKPMANEFLFIRHCKRHYGRANETPERNFYEALDDPDAQLGVYESPVDDDYFAHQIWIVPTRVSPSKSAAANAASCAKVVHADGVVTRADPDLTIGDLYAEFKSDIALRPSREDALRLPDNNIRTTVHLVFCSTNDPDTLLTTIRDEPAASQKVLADLMQTETGRGQLKEVIDLI
uniref:Uncharacterized protein n=1 Tax=Hyaloperonospora arabidopsidis (strain Emoy2) TaxID=559515 RepID=M4BQZ0_HYAAE